MAFHCQFCDVRHPEGDTKLIMTGMDFIEFCPPCGDKDDMVQLEGRPDIRTLNQLFTMDEANLDNNYCDWNEDIYSCPDDCEYCTRTKKA